MNNLSENLASQLGGPELSHQPAWVSDLRSRAANDFQRFGLPHVRQETWKYTSLRSLERVVKTLGDPGTERQEALDALPVKADMRVVMVNGAYSSQTGALHDGVTMQALGDALEAGHRALKPLLSSLDTSKPDRGFAALNNATLRQGLFIHVPAGLNAGRVLVQWLRSGHDSDELFNSRVCIVLEEHAALELVEQFASDANKPPALNVVMQCRLASQARLQLARLQQESSSAALITRTEIEQASSSISHFTALDLGGGLVRHDLHARMSGAGAECHLHGAYLPRGRSHVDVHLNIEHAAPDCSSLQFFRGVLTDRGRAVFNGRVHILEGADGADASQSNANLLLSPHAEVDTKPELEIYADEVVANHGATVGELDEDAVFYLRSRGLDREQATQLLTRAFSQSAIDYLPEGPVREAFTERLSASLNGGGSS